MSKFTSFASRVLRAVVGTICLIFMIVSLQACGGGGSDGQVASIKAVHGLKGVGPISVLIDGVVVSGDLRYGEGSVYRDFDEAPRHVVISLNQTGEVIAEEDFDFADGRDYTLVVGPSGNHNSSGSGGIFGIFQGSFSAYEIVVLADDNGLDDDSIGKVRFYNAAKEAGRVDVYFTKDDEVIADRDPDFLYQDFQQVTYYLKKEAGDYRYRVALSGSRGIDLDSGPFRLNKKEVRTIVILDGPNEDLPIIASVLADRN